ncbi:methyltransferase domain-containing protein [Streptomyces sp. H10-C2]|uniref:class I SAM-dependent methyltransferase n=1 Tax=unclassified Streptomyces TaxID=2593676 RepID=UPI0024B9B1CE|nr:MULTISPECIES: methyltransferase domain-containing protein [unclassified Streptomyces]MDJ0342994.1 methyltransferase domain-containing protein [Streptomyces sp. PH10-H1]MDJ0371445.1 methyltransferase domain-containing protein [Streptomyces sp. H10-C2]
METERDRVREFFAAKAVGWEKRFPDDGPAYDAAVAELGLRPGQSALDAGCGTGRALPALRQAVGPAGTVIGADLTPEMLREATVLGRHRAGSLVEADSSRLPLRDACLEGVFAAGLLHHLPDPAAGLREFARVTGPGGRLALFHPIGRAALAARRGHTLHEDDVRAKPNLSPLLTDAGWELVVFDDSEDRYLAVAVRQR